MIYIFRQSFNQSQSLDEYYDASSYPYQDERYGQDEEDRQWDSGGYFDNSSVVSSTKKVGSKKLPSIPLVENYLNKRRSSIVMQNDVSGLGSYEENYTPTPRRRMPQLPTKRSSSRQSSVNDEFDGFKTPENSSHRGASLPPTPTKTPKVLRRWETYKFFIIYKLHK